MRLGYKLTISIWSLGWIAGSILSTSGSYSYPSSYSSLMFLRFLLLSAVAVAVVAVADIPLLVYFQTVLHFQISPLNTTNPRVSYANRYSALMHLFCYDRLLLLVKVSNKSEQRSVKPFLSIIICIGNSLVVYSLICCMASLRRYCKSRDIKAGDTCRVWAISSWL